MSSRPIAQPILVTLVVGWFTLVFLLTALPVSAQDPNLKRMTCVDFKVHLAVTGVIDDSGTPRPRYYAWATPHYKPGTPVRVQGPEGIPSTRGKLLCRRQAVRLTWSSSPRIARLQWIPSPPACNACACQEEIARWQEAVSSHERHHAVDFLFLAKQWDKKWNPKYVYACSTNVQRAIAGLPRAITRETDVGLKALDAASQAKEERYHTVNVDLDLECKPCNECSPGRTPHNCLQCEKCLGGVCINDRCDDDGKQWLLLDHTGQTRRTYT